MRALYLNHTARMSGGELSLLTLLAGLPDDVSPTVACPEGPLTEEVQALGIPVVELPGTDASLRLHPRHTTRALVDMTRAAWRVRRLGAELQLDLVHANSIRAGIVATAAAKLGGPPAVVHVRDCLPPRRVSSQTLRFIGRGAAAVLVNSRYTGETVLREHPAARVRVVYSPVDLERFDPATLDRADSRRRLGLSASAFVLTVVAQITPWKGQADAIRTVELLRSRLPEVRLLLVGSAKFVSDATRYDNRSYLGELSRLVEEHDLREQVAFLGERDDVPRILRATDVLLAPSWEEPFGRSVVEAMAMGIPVVATSTGGPSEVLRDGQEGLLLSPRDPGRWAAGLEPLIADPDLRRAMGERGRRRAVAFGTEQHVDGVLRAYADYLPPGPSVAALGRRRRLSSHSS